MSQQPPRPDGTEPDRQSQPQYGGPQARPSQPPGPPQYGPPNPASPNQPGGQPPAYAGQPYAQQPHPYGPANAGPYGGPALTQRNQPLSGPARMIGWVAATAGILAIVGCFGPWVSADFGFAHIAMNGYGQISGTVHDSPKEVKDGVLVTGFAVIAIVFGVLRGLGRIALAAAIAILLVGVLGLATTIYDATDVGSKLDGASVGWGLWVSLAASAVLVLTGLAGLVRRR